LTTFQGSFSRSMRAATRCTQPCSGERLYAAERLSPNTITVRGAAPAAAAKAMASAASHARATRK